MIEGVVADLMARLDEAGRQVGELLHLGAGEEEGGRDVVAIEDGEDGIAGEWGGPIVEGEGDEGPCRLDLSDEAAEELGRSGVGQEPRAPRRRQEEGDGRGDERHLLHPARPSSGSSRRR